VLQDVRPGERTRIDMGNLPSGIYFVTLQSDNRLQTHKIIKP